MNTFPRALALGALALATGLAVACSDSAGTTATESPSATASESEPHGSYLDRFASFGEDYEQAPTFAALADRSTLVVTARLDEIRPGRTFGTSPTDETRSEHLVHVFTVTKVLKGEHRGPRLFVEIPKPDFEPAAGYDKAKPATAEAVLYLKPVPEPKGGTPVIDPRAGLDPGATAYRPASPQGFLLVVGGKVIHPLSARTPSPRVFPEESPTPTDLRTWLPAPLRAVAG